MVYCSVDRSEYLVHHGIKGQKWGVRRFQNPDGSLTPAGKARFGKLIEFNDAYKKAQKEHAKAFDAQVNYVIKKTGMGKRANWSDVKRASKDLYWEDKDFRPIFNKTDSTAITMNNISDKVSKMERRIANSHYGLFTQIGCERLRQIMNDYENYRLKNLK